MSCVLVPLSLEETGEVISFSGCVCRKNYLFAVMFFNETSLSGIMVAQFKEEHFFD